MIKKISNEEKVGNTHISILFPGNSLEGNDSGIGSIGRVDQANINSGTTIKMHPHVNDEILSYFRTGTVEHLDSVGNRVNITRKRLMLMKAGNVFYHEEKIEDQLEGLQIFIRPQSKDDVPDVSFYDLDPVDSINEWRLIASNQNESALKFTSLTEIYDIQITRENAHSIPHTNIVNPTYLLYCFQGEVMVNQAISLDKGESLVIENENLTIESNTLAELVLFVTDKNQECFKGGMFSGNRML